MKGYPLFVAVPCPQCGVVQVYPVRNLDNGFTSMKESCKSCGEALEITVGGPAPLEPSKADVL